METMRIPYNLVENGVAPYKATAGAAGYDLHIRNIETHPLCVPQVIRCNLGVRFAIPDGYVGKLHLRSGLSSMGFILANGVGVIDSDYRGEITAVIFNMYPGTNSLQPKQRIAQILFEKVEPMYLEYVSDEDFTEDFTDRGEGGFGSTGK